MCVEYLCFILHFAESRSRSSSTTLRANSFVLSLCSPVLQTMLCGSFIESSKKEIQLLDVDGKTFEKAIDMWCGKLDNVEMVMDEVREVASVVDRFQITEVASVLDETITKHLSMRICSDVLNWSGELGLRQSEQAAQKLAMDRFNELVQTEGFVRIDADGCGQTRTDSDSDRLGRG